jgi:putative transcriptional regulator
MAEWYGENTALVEYAAGMADAASALVVESHLAYSASSRQKMADYLTVAGAVLEEAGGAEPAPLTDADWQAFFPNLRRAAQLTAFPTAFIHSDNGQSYPEALQRYLTAASKNPAQGRWRHFGKFSDFRLFRDGPAECSLLALAPHGTIPQHSHRGSELVLVLEGTLHDENGTYTRGDLIAATPDMQHTPHTRDEACICLAATAAPIRLHGWRGLVADALNLARQGGKLPVSLSL